MLFVRVGSVRWHFSFGSCVGIIFFFHFIVRNWNRIMNSNNNYIPHLLARVAQKVHRNWPHNCNIFHERARKSDIQWWIFSHRFIVLRSKPILCEFFIRLTTPFPDALLSLYKFISATTFTWVSSNYSNLHATLTHTHTQCHRGNWLKLLITWTQTKCTKWTVNSIWYLITTVNWNLPWTASTVTIKLPPIMIAIATKTTNLIIATVFFHCQFQIGIYLFYGVFLLLW